MISLARAKVLIVGLVRDCALSLSGSIQALQSAFHGASSVSFFVVESDSHDNTPDVLRRLAIDNPDFSFQCMGDLSSTLPLRTQRIAHCRNQCIRHIEQANLWGHYDYVVIADLDGVNDALTSEAIASCWDRDDWDVVTANQDGPYYDIWALRHPLWSPNDCWEQARFLAGHGISFYCAMQASVYSRMIRLAPDSSWIEVDSAFGGLAIYKSSSLRKAEYIGLNGRGEEICEHVSVHTGIRSMGGRIFVNPRLMNAGVVEHARAMSGLSGLRLYLRSKLRDALLKAGLLETAKAVKRSR